MTRPYDVAILGNSISGLSLAYALIAESPGMKIAVIGPAARAGAATTTAGAMLNAWAELAPGQFDDPALADRASLSLESLALWDPLCAELSEFGGPPLKPTWGTYVLNTASGSPHEMRAVDYMIAQMRERRVAHEVLAGDALTWLKPDPKGATVRIVRVPDGRIDPLLVLAAYEHALDARGVTRIDATVSNVSIERDNGVALSNGDKLATGQIVFANGSFAQKLIDPIPELRCATPRLLWGGGAALDISLPDWVKRYELGPDLLSIDAVVRTVDRGGACGVHLIPKGEGEFYLGASSGVWFEPEDKARIHGLNVLMRSIVEEMNTSFFFGTMAIRGPGFRPTTVDTFPLLGESHLKGVWFNNGMKRDGFTCSPLIARELASAMMGGASTLPARFTPSRSLISYKTREAALDDTVAANYGGEVQHGLALPAYAVALHKEGMRAKYAKIYDDREITDFGIHPELITLYENDDFFAAIDHKRDKG